MNCWALRGIPITSRPPRRTKLFSQSGKDGLTAHHGVAWRRPRLCRIPPNGLPEQAVYLNRHFPLPSEFVDNEFASTVEDAVHTSKIARRLDEKGGIGPS